MSVPLLSVEICLGGSRPVLPANLAAARAGGAARVELCSGLAVGGLTPARWQVEAAAGLLHGGPELVVLLRPRPDFRLGPRDVESLARRMSHAALLGAGGVALGALRGKELDRPVMAALVRIAHELGLRVTCHRAFDGVEDRQGAQEMLIDLGMDRLLTSGCVWESGGSALDGMPVLRQALVAAAGRMELVVAGRLHPGMVPDLQQALGGRGYSLHACSGVLRRRRVDEARVRQLVLAAS
ncbi:MAG: copper homeostasis protein CutC [bacterium]|jgi:copper homeostasis protein|nr:copper homeostasis protein CutC [bacterium]